MRNKSIEVLRELEKVENITFACNTESLFYDLDFN